MTITGMTRFVQQNYKVQNSHLTPKLPNGSLPPKGHVNPYCPEGMDITGRTDFRRIVPVDEGVANKIKSLVFESMKKNCGMSDGEIESEIIRNYVMSLPPEERAAAGQMISVSINLFRDIFPVSMKTVRIQTAQDVEMIQHPRETWYGNILWIPYVTGQTNIIWMVLDLTWLDF
mgnify:CR=1 FL=1